MRRLPDEPERDQSLGEEIANSLSHGLPLLAAIAGAPFLIAHSTRLGDGGFVAGATVFAVCVILLYLASTVYHALPAGRAKRVFRVLDHSAIFLLIAGTYTPFTLGVLRGAWGWTLFGLVWGLAALGVTLKAVGRASHPWLSTGLYLAMGWVVVIAVDPLLERVSTQGIAWLLAGGLAYTVGVAFFATDSRLRYGHTVWHLFVAAGTGAHYFAVLRYAA
jgi:hemolysin III